MVTPSTPNITQLLVAWRAGDPKALEALAPVIHEELHRAAHRYMAGERPGHVLQTTALVNEAYVRLVDWKNVQWQNRAHFFGVAAQMMRRILVDFARDLGRTKRGGHALRIALSDIVDLPLKRAADMVALDDALNALEAFDHRKSRVVELRFFGGLSLEEIAEALGVSVATVRRDWSLARAWLYRELGGGPRVRSHVPARNNR
ncbi:MAG: sigma-70 family RNA polymerase sigma factor [Vicinamibacterales bacterium]